MLNHQTVRRHVLGRKIGEDPVKDAHARPENEPAVERLVRAIDRGCIPPPQTIPDNMDYPTYDTTVNRPGIAGGSNS